MYQYLAVFFGIIAQAYGSLILKSLVKNFTVEFEDAEATFGAVITDELPSGNISLSHPLSACSKVANPPGGGVFFALAERGNCDFVVKVLAIQTAHYLGAIIINTESDYVFPMGSDKNVNITIPAIMIGRTSGKRIRDFYLYCNGFLAQIKPNSAIAIEYYLVPLLITLSLAFLGIIIFLSVRFLRNFLRQSKNRLSRDTLNKLPEIRFSEDYQNLYETCAICLEDYAMGDKLRVLPCHHAYHSKCVDRWLLRRQRSCPVCKYRIHRSRDEPGSDVDDRHTNEGISDATQQMEQEGAPAGASVPAASASTSGRARPAESTASLEYDDISGDDVAPLLSKSAPVSSWLSGGQLPLQGTTWLGYDNPAVEADDNAESIDWQLRPPPVRSARQIKHWPKSGQVPEVSCPDPSSADHQQLPRTEATIEVLMEGDPENEEGKEAENLQRFSS